MQDLPSAPWGPLVGRSPAMLEVFSKLERFCQTEAPLLLTGESGTGKELVARLLHERSARAGKPFLAVNCAAFPESLLESELFGHERGAFTGAVKRREGRFKAADGGTLLLDEVGEMPPPAQAKLLRVLQDGRFEPLGTNQSIGVDVRVVAATHRDLKALVAAGRFRDDLYYRLKILELSIPALREREGDLMLLVEHFLRLHVPGDPPHLSEEAAAALAAHSFPGNVRELEHAVQHAVALAAGAPVIELAHLPMDIAGDAPPPGLPMRPLAESIREFERGQLLEALARSGGRRARAAEMLGISRKSLWEKLHRHGLERFDREEVTEEVTGAGEPLPPSPPGAPEKPRGRL